jgi:ubiquinone/menaquinone biosynthesis C-methylase UbiE
MMTAYQHLELLCREDRTAALYDAIRSAVKPGMRVLDAGTGTGILAMWAVRAGADRVVAIDFSHGGLARALLKENDCDRAVEFVSADLRQLPLPGVSGRFDAVFALLYFNDPRRDEKQAELAWRLLQEYLKPGGVCIPDGIHYRAVACEWPEQAIGTRRARVEHQIRGLESRYDVKLRALSEAMFDPPAAALFPARERSGKLMRESARFLSGETDFARIDFTAGRPERLYPDALSFVANAAGSCDSVVWLQDLCFQGRTIFRNESMSWIDEPILVEPGTRFSVAIDDRWRRTNVLGAVL